MADPPWSEISKAMDRAQERIREERKPQIVYKRNGRAAVLSLKAYLDADLDHKGAKRVAVVTVNAFGKII